MAGTQKIIYNDTTADITIPEAGLVVDTTSSIDLLDHPFTHVEIATFDSLLPLIADGSIVVNDGEDDLDAAGGIRLLFNIQGQYDESGSLKTNIAANPLTYDGKLVVHASPRPTSPKTYTHYTSFGDDIANSIVRGGEELCFELTADQTSAYKDFWFMGEAWSYVRGATFAWENAPWNTHLIGDFYASATQLYEDTTTGLYSIDEYHRIHLDIADGTMSLAANPVLVPAQGGYWDYEGMNPYGYWDYDGTYLTYNSDGEGRYNIFDIDINVVNFMTVRLYGSNYAMHNLMSDDVEYFQPGYFLRIIVTKQNSQAMKLWGWFFMYKAKTV
jgi:hypothetical protein